MKKKNLCFILFENHYFIRYKGLLEVWLKLLKDKTLRMNGERIFYCKYHECEYSSISFNRVLNHAWERHSISQGFEYKCDISSCTGKYTNMQSFRRHLKSHHSCFYDSFVRRFAGENHNCQLEVDEVGIIDENILIEPPD